MPFRSQQLAPDRYSHRLTPRRHDLARQHNTKTEHGTYAALARACSGEYALSACGRAFRH